MGALLAILGIAVMVAFYIGIDRKFFKIVEKTGVAMVTRNKELEGEK